MSGDKDLEPSGPAGLRGDFVAYGGRRSGKTGAMMRELARAKPGLVAVVGINGTRFIDVQGDAVVVPPAGLPAPEPSSAKGSNPPLDPNPNPQEQSP